MKMNRQLHLWIGLLCSIIILLESITGLLLSEPWLMGVERKEGMRPHQAVMENQTTQTVQTQTSNNQQEDQGLMQPEGRREQGGLMMVVRQLHEGRIGSMDATWLADISAIAMIILTITGITISIKTLRVQSVRRRKLHQEKLDSNCP